MLEKLRCTLPSLWRHHEGAWKKKAIKLKKPRRWLILPHLILNEGSLLQISFHIFFPFCLLCFSFSPPAFRSQKWVCQTDPFLMNCLLENRSNHWQAVVRLQWETAACLLPLTGGRRWPTTSVPLGEVVSVSSEELCVLSGIHPWFVKASGFVLSCSCKKPGIYLGYYL